MQIIFLILTCIFFSLNLTCQTSYNYNSQNYLTTVEYPNGEEVEYNYDNLGNRISCTLTGHCPDYLTISQNPTIDNTYRADIELDSNVPINNNGNVVFKAGQSVKLKTGFKASVGTYFLGTLEGCPTTFNEANQNRTRQSYDKNKPIQENTRENYIQYSSKEISSFLELEYKTASDSPIKLILQDQQGNPLVTLLDKEIVSAGTYTFKFSKQILPTGTYIVAMALKDATYQTQITIL